MATSIIKRQPKLDLAHLRTLVEGLKEGVDLSRELLDDLLALYADKRANLLAATRMTLECGLPHDWTRPSLPQPEENPAK